MFYFFVSGSRGSVEQALPDSLSASPTKAAEDLSGLSALSEVSDSASFLTSCSADNNVEPPTTSSGVSPR